MKSLSSLRSQRLRRHATIGLYQIEFLITFNISFYIFQKQNNLPGVRWNLLNEVNDYADTVGVVNKNKKVPETVFACSYGAQINLF